jgi:rod shape-determining protein MreC
MLLPKKFRISITITILVVVAAFILFYNLRHTSPGILRKMSMEIVASLDTVTNKPLSGMRDAWNRYIFLVGLEDNNRRLKEINSRLSGEIIKYRESYLESIRLQNILKLRENIPFPTIAARVVGKNPSSIFNMILINRGEAEGLHAGLPVVSGQGVIGRILETSWNISRVLLIIDENSNIDALVQESRVQGVLQGASSGCILKYISKTSEVKAGDIVISSGLGGLFPKGLPLGIVKSASKKEADLFQRVNVTPFVDPAGVEEVLVVVSDWGGKK